MRNNKKRAAGMLAGYITLQELKKYYKLNKRMIRNNPFSQALRLIIAMFIVVFILASETLADEAETQTDTAEFTQENEYTDYGKHEATDEMDQYVADYRDESFFLYKNPDTGYVVYICDEADLLSDYDEEKLSEEMMPITEYGNVSFATIDKDHSYSTAYYTEDRYQELFDWDSGTMFMIDMYDREIYIHSDGDLYKTVNNGKALTITDNAYKLAGKGDYYGCASLVFDQMLRVLQGEHIAQPMKYTSNAVLAILLALLMNFGLLILSRRGYKHELTRKEQLLHALQTFSIGKVTEQFISQKKVYSPPSSSSSGGHHHSGGHSGGGHSGGGHHGGGGGHRF